MKTLIDTQTGEEIVREFTPEEIAELEQQNAQAEEERLAAERAEEEKQAKIESAKAKLTALGLDEAEVQAILGL